jgi:hypothetical protein
MEYAMTLVDVDCRPQVEYSIQVAGYFGKQRVVYEIPREALDDYFPKRPHLTDKERHTLVKSNLGSITAVMQQKCEQQAWSETNRGRGTFWFLDFNARDLKLSDHQLVADEKAKAEAQDSA